MTTDRIQKAEKALAFFDQKIEALADRERETTRAFAADPSEALSAKVREARMVLDDWRRGREVALANLEAAKKTEADDLRSAKARRVEELTTFASMRESRRAYEAIIDARVLPALATLRDALDALNDEVTRRQQAAANAQSEGAELGKSITTQMTSAAHLQAVLIAGLQRDALASDGRERTLTAAIKIGRGYLDSSHAEDDIVVTNRVMTAVGLAPTLPPSQLSYAEQQRRALDGDDVYAELRAEQTARENAARDAAPTPTRGRTTTTAN